MGAIAKTTATLASAVNDGGTVTVSYPAGTVQATLLGTTGGQVVVNSNDYWNQAASGAGTVAFTFGSSNITVTNNTGVTWAAGSDLILSFGHSDNDGRYTTGAQVTPSIVALTAATGTASNTINDVGGSFSQTTLNNNIKSLADKINEIVTLLKSAGVAAN